jgi:putrescine transport system substrate-binding protein
VLIKIRPYIRNVDSSIDTEALANGDVCVALTYNGTAFQARRRAHEANNGITIRYVIPNEGSLLWFDMLAIPRDAPHAANAHLFINYLMNPPVIARISNFIGNANANSAASPLLDKEIVADATVYPPPDQQRRLFVQTEDSPEQSRAITRIWQRFKTAQ